MPEWKGEREYSDSSDSNSLLPLGISTPVYIGLAQIKPPAGETRARSSLRQRANPTHSPSLSLSHSFLSLSAYLSLSLLTLLYTLRGRAKGLVAALGRTQDTSDAALAHSSSLARRLFFSSSSRSFRSFHSDLVSCSTNAKKKFLFFSTFSALVPAPLRLRLRLRLCPLPLSFSVLVVEFETLLRPKEWEIAWGSGRRRATCQAVARGKGIRQGQRLRLRLRLQLQLWQHI